MAALLFAGESGAKPAGGVRHLRQTVDHCVVPGLSREGGKAAARLCGKRGHGTPTAGDGQHCVSARSADPTRAGDATDTFSGATCTDAIPGMRAGLPTGARHRYGPERTGDSGCVLQELPAILSAPDAEASTPDGELLDQPSVQEQLSIWEGRADGSGPRTGAERGK